MENPKLLKLADLCARSEQCEYDLRRKMIHARMDREEIDAIIARLREGGFIDDFRYARAYASHKSRIDGWGPMKIRQALAAKHIRREAITEALDEIEDDTYTTALRKAAEKKAARLDLSDRNDRAKLMRHLAGKGFPMSDIIREIERLKN